VIPHYNLACVAALQHDVPGAVAELDWLTHSADPAARASLQKALTDEDLASVRDDPRVRALLGPAAPAAAAGPAVTRKLGLSVLAWTDKPTATAEGENDDCRELRSFTLDQTGVPGWRQLAGSYDDGIQILGDKGKVLASGAEQPCLLGLGLAQVVPDDELEIVVHRIEQVGRGAYDEQIAVFKRNGAKLDEIFTGTLPHITFAPDGTIRYRDPDAKKEQRLHWDGTKHKFVP
jgi:hypothetical protein